MKKQEILSLRKKAHKLNPVVIIGGNGLTDAVQNEIHSSLEAHELIKIRMHTQNRDDVLAAVKTICEKQHATLIQQIGHTIVIYRQREEE